MNRAKLLANLYAALSPETHMLHIYDDGYVVGAAVSDGTRDRIAETLRGQFDTVEEARSDDGFFTAFVLPCVPAAGYRDALLKAMTGGGCDHRMDDVHMLDHLVERAQKVADDLAA